MLASSGIPEPLGDARTRDEGTTDERRGRATLFRSNGRSMLARRCAAAVYVLSLGWGVPGLVQPALCADAPIPLLAANSPVDWWFVFKFNATTHPGCGTDSGARTCRFGGEVQTYRFGQQYVYASSLNGKLTQGKGCVGATTMDPVGATFEQVYFGSFYYAAWNDQPYGDPKLCGNSDSCGAPWGHSKGMLAFNDAGEGFVMQVSTPSWPVALNKKWPRASGNTLGCVENNNVMFSQHFFALKLTRDDLVKVLRALQNASVATDPTNPQLVRNGGPADIQRLVDGLGTKSYSTTVMKEQLSTGVVLVSKPSKLPLPPWQLVSSVLAGEDSRTATWWHTPLIYSTTENTRIRCWDDAFAKPGPVDIATSGEWHGVEFGLKGAPNHAKIGVTTSGTKHYSVFGDMNQQGTISPPKCERSQNGRGGLFYAIDNEDLFTSVAALIHGDTAPSRAPR